MAKITLPPLPGNGSDLLATKSVSDVDDAYTKSIYANFDSPDKEGLMSTLNGRLDYNNLGRGFQVQDYHIQPEQASLARMESMNSTSTIYGDGVPNLVDEANFFTLPGCSLRWHQPYDTSVSLLQWSFFLSYNCWRGIFKDMEGVIHSRGVNSPISIRCRINNTVVPGSTRHLGQNMFHPVSPGAMDRTDQTGPGVDSFGFFEAKAEERGALEETVSEIETWKYGIPIDDDEPTASQRGGNPQYVSSEAHTATQFDLHHTTSLSKGFNEISVECSIVLPESAGVYLQNVGRRGKTFVTGRGYFNLVGKVSLGIRNARVLNLL
jgi:hypothetical protein